MQDYTDSAPNSTVLVVSMKIKIALNCEMGEMQEDAVLICLRFKTINWRVLGGGGGGM